MVFVRSLASKDAEALDLNSSEKILIEIFYWKKLSKSFAVSLINLFNIFLKTNADMQLRHFNCFLFIQNQCNIVTDSTKWTHLLIFLPSSEALPEISSSRLQCKLLSRDVATKSRKFSCEKEFSRTRNKNHSIAGLKNQ